MYIQLLSPARLKKAVLNHRALTVAKLFEELSLEPTLLFRDTGRPGRPAIVWLGEELPRPRRVFRKTRQTGAACAFRRLLPPDD